MLCNRINIILVLLLFSFFAGCATSPPVPSATYSQEGKGSKTYPNGTRYVGVLKNGKKHGPGTLTWPDGTIYVGQFKDDKKDGQGTLTWPNGRKYVGAFKNAKFDGQGTFIWPNRYQYVGGFVDHKRDGQGTLTWQNGMKYVGGFKNDQFDGQGTLTWPNGTTYAGVFKDDRPNVPGEYTFPGGASYKGKVHMSAYISELMKDSQAERIGLQAGDIVVEYNDVPITTGPKLLVQLVSTTKPDNKVNLKVLRSETEKNFTLNGGRIGIGILSYPTIPAHVYKSINVAASYGPHLSAQKNLNITGSDGRSSLAYPTTRIHESLHYVMLQQMQNHSMTGRYHPMAANMRRHKLSFS